MTHLSTRLQEFLDATLNAIAARTGAGTAVATAMQRVGAAIPISDRVRQEHQPRTFPACAHLDAAIANATAGGTDIARVARAIEGIAPELCWRVKESDDPLFANGHANADILGSSPEALEQRDDVRIGLSLMAPGIVYPDHSHPPEEVYLVLSSGSWRHGDVDWQEPGVGGIFYNPRGITHAMRSSSKPLLAIWCLPID